jgi:hypothetical protein
MNRGSVSLIVLLALCLAAAGIVFLPFLTIWCVNTLWDMNNPYDFTHWFAALCIGAGLFGSGTARGRKRDD